MSKPPRPQSIVSIGLRQYLNDTAGVHNGYGYDDYLKFKESIGPYNRAKLMKVSADTIYRWDRICNEGVV